MRVHSAVHFLDLPEMIARLVVDALTTIDVIEWQFVILHILIVLIAFKCAPCSVMQCVDINVISVILLWLVVFVLKLVHLLAIGLASLVHLTQLMLTVIHDGRLRIACR